MVLNTACLYTPEFQLKEHTIFEYSLHPPSSMLSSFRFSFRLCEYYYSLLTLKRSAYIQHSILFFFILYSRFSFLTLASLRLRSSVHLTVVSKLIHLFYFILNLDSDSSNKNQEKNVK